MAQAIDRKEAHDLIDQLTPEQVPAAIPVLRSMLPKPIEDEEISEAEKEAVAEADEWLKHNKPIPFEDVLADFGLTVEDLDRSTTQARADVRRLDQPTAMRILKC